MILFIINSFAQRLREGQKLSHGGHLKFEGFKLDYSQDLTDGADPLFKIKSLRQHLLFREPRVPL